MGGSARNSAKAWTWQVSKEDSGKAPPDAKPDSPGKPPAPAGPTDPEAKATELLEQAKQAIEAGKTSLARVRLNIIVTDYPQTKAAKEAKKLLEKLSK